MHRKIQVIIIQNETIPSEVLLLKTNKKRQGFWQNVTGSVENEETDIDAAKRELFEETGLIAPNLFPLSYTFQFKDDFGREVQEKCFLALFDKKPQKIQISPEHEKFLWVKIDMMDINRYGHKSSYMAYLEALSLLKKT
ncbi:MAG: hypothetical protein A2381_01380 [Bdellovibrionales bacterium RIFOXYB1_FULL_37_110]|nr:MAG: hypothetical protein A2417_02235 [Bdellovibrionales bacterium RIFOXYC1_FULL_37_79]OFZ58869.1 MAG: hypothetical protein A2381_01380 [Bdellovibrionales bacterium RIFOXYB1_FULL_37_110]OFZ64685.1 MAG: hypothetical protein A2577_13555 [Bdellovibrionales bacterium RIFOXYD1_FULL_36_51]